MRKLILAVVCLGSFFTGCATDGAYSVGKTVYKGGKTIVKELPLKDETKEKLGKVDRVATTYDKTRSKVRGNETDATTLEATKK